MRKAVSFFIVLCVVFTSFSGMMVKADWTPSAEPSSSSVYLVNSDTGTVLYQKNANEKVFPASITKLMTAILAVEKYKDNLNTVLTVDRQDIESLAGTSSSSADLKIGEQLTVEQLLYCLLLPSANDAANVLARSVGGDVSTFVSMMNKKAAELGAKSTHYVNPHGLQDPEQYTTASDVYLIAKYAMSGMSTDILSKIVATQSYTIPQTNAHAQRKLTNTNLLLQSGTYYLRYVKGIKTGTTSEAGACLVSYAEKDGVTYYAVVMGGQKSSTSNSSFTDSKSLLQWALSSFEIKSLVNTGTPQAEVPLELAWNKSTLQLVLDKPFNTLIKSSDKNGTVKVVANNLPKTLKAPVKKGQKVATADVLFNNQKVGTVNLVASTNVERSAPLYFVYLVGKFFTSIWFIIISVLLVAILVSYIVLSYRYNKKRRRLSNKRGKRYKMK